MSNFYDTLEQRTLRTPAAKPPSWPRCRSRSRMRKTHAPAFAGILKGINGAAVTSRAALARLPVTRKHELLERQQAARQAAAATPLAASARCASARAMPRVFASPGTIYEPDSTRKDYWRLARALFAAGFGRASWCTTASATTSCRPAP
jgi:phenylacetate-CoA ligase